MITLSAVQQKHEKSVDAALNRVLGRSRRIAVRDLVASEMTGGRQPAAREMLSWMRVNMPVSADQVDDVMFPQPFRD